MFKKNNPLVLAPNLKIKLSGVTSTIIALVPIQSKLISISTTGPGLPRGIPHISLFKTIFLSRSVSRVWHARRNTEMLVGMLLKIIFRCNFILIFTSEAQRKHTFFKKFLINRMNYVIAPSTQSQSYVEVPSTVISHGIDTKHFFPCKNKEKLRKSLGLPEGLLIGCFGRIRPLKGTNIFVESAVRVLKSNDRVTFLIIGRTTKKFRKFKKSLTKKINDLSLGEKILFLDEVSWNQIAQYYRSLDLFVTPSIYEGFGLTPIEAMASGTPVIAFKDVGSFNEQIVDKKTGLLLDNKCSKELAEAIIRVISDPKELLAYSKNARQHVLQNFNIITEAKSLIKIYKQLLKNSVV